MWRQSIAVLYSIFNCSLALTRSKDNFTTPSIQTSVADPPPFNCVGQQQWTRPLLRESDCYGTLFLLHRVGEAMKSGLYEFLATGIIPTHTQFKPIHTPIRLRTCGLRGVALRLCMADTSTVSCTLVVQMVSDAGHIPGKAPGGQEYVFTDLASFNDIEEAAESVFLRCVMGQDLAGWHSAGKSSGFFGSERERERNDVFHSNLTSPSYIGRRHGIIVSFWATGSQQDGRLPELLHDMNTLDVTNVSSHYRATD